MTKRQIANRSIMWNRDYYHDSYYLSIDMVNGLY